MQQHERQPDVITNNAVISACTKGSLTKRALQALADAAEGLQPNVSPAAVISACEKGSMTMMSLQLLDEVQQ